MSKKEIRANAMKQIGIGQKKITGAEFKFGFKDITLVELEAERAEGNRLILEALDSAEAAGVQLPL